MHDEPKKPDAQDSHDEPVNPVEQEHVPAAEQIPAPAQGGEQAADWTSRTESSLESEETCEMSGIESQRMTRLLDEPEETAAHMLDESATAPAEIVVSALELLAVELVGSEVKEAWPE